jgi:CRISPR type III-B/RAMP module RAMP protein Cmr1
MQNSNLWVEVQKILVNEDIIFDAVCFTISYTRIGGYLGRPYSSTLSLQEKIRTSEIKGIWRWWARVLLATALYNKGYNVTNLQKLDKYISETVGGEKNPSKFILKISCKEIREGDKISPSRIQEIPRIKLLLRLRKEEQKQYKPYEIKKLETLININYNFQLTIIKSQRNIDRREMDFALYSLVLALLLSGTGSLLNRGFGKIKIDLKVCINDELRESLKRLYSSKNEEDVRNNLNSFIKNAINSAERYLLFLEENKKLDYAKLSGSNKEPIIPMFIDDYFKLEILKVPENKQGDILKCIGKSTSKLEWKSYRLYKSTTENLDSKKKEEVYKEHGIQYHTWILGMPRSSEVEGTTTGYIGIDRRISSVAFSLLKSNLNVYYIIIYGFLTYDWKNSIEYKGKDEGKIFEILENKGALNPVENSIIKPANIRNVFEIAFETSKTILEKCLALR